MPLLHGKNTTLIITESYLGLPSIQYFGSKLSDSFSESDYTEYTQGPIPQGGLDEAPEITIAPTLADHSFLKPGLQIHQSGQHWAPQWRVHSRQFTDASLKYILVDHSTQLQLTWSVCVAVESNVYTIDCLISNNGSSPLELVQWRSTVPLPMDVNQVKAFTGRWVHEFQPTDAPLPIGALEFVNLKGRTSHDHFPGLIVSDGTAQAAKGKCFGFHLGWSGNHCQRVERSQNGLTQYQAGIELAPGEVILEPNDTFEAAPLYFTVTDEGLAGISENFQSFVRQNILTFPTQKERPVHINTWEAIYFNHNQQALDSLAAAAKECGAERFVLDDGWFPRRRDDTAGLGDWTVDTSIYPQGLHPLKTTLEKHELSFGLWLEPEMVNKNSDLYRDHPDWVLELAEHVQVPGRNQWVLDISRPEIQSYLFNAIDTLLTEYPIDYIKWDMNRDLSQAGNAHGKPAYHQYVKSLYVLLDNIRKAHPTVEIESCASGGGRMDYGILKYTHRFWLSDCNDANERQTMQQWATLFFPAETLGSHIGPQISHTTSRSHATAVRAGTAMFGHMGIEWDVRKLSIDERAELKSYIDLYKKIRKDIHANIRYPLAMPDAHQIGFEIFAPQKSIVSIFQKSMPMLAVPGNLKLPRLDSNSKYKIDILIEPEHTDHLMKKKPQWMTCSHAVFDGEYFNKIGLPLPVLDPETLLVIELTKI